MTSADLEELYRCRFVGFKRALASVTGDYASAEEALQEAFARALASLHRFRGEGPLAAWVWTIAWRVALDLRRVAVRDNSAGLEDVALVPELVDHGHDPRLREAVRALPPRRRLIVFLRYFADCSYAEIAAICRVSEGTVAASLAQARNTLAEALELDAQAQLPDAKELRR